MRLTIMQSSHSISTLFSLKIWQIHLLEYIYQSITRISVAFHFMTFLSIYTFSAEWNTWESCGFLSSKFCVSAAVSLIKLTMRWFSSVQFSRSAVSNSLRPHGLQLARPPCPSPTPQVYSDSCPLSWWCHPTISSSVIHFSCLQSFPASGSFQTHQFFTSGGQNIGVLASASLLPMNTQDWPPLGWTYWIHAPIKTHSM